MTEITDIIDTAVKIGLGALITGAVTYLLADRQFSNDIKKKNIEDHKNILKEISLKIEKSESHLNEATNSYVRNRHQDFTPEPMLHATSEAYEASLFPYTIIV